MKIDYQKIQDESEVGCVTRFLDNYNRYNHTNFENPVKNPIQNEVDVFCYEVVSNKVLKIQVKKADSIIVGNLGRSRKVPLYRRPLIARSNIEAVEHILGNIRLAEGRYTKQHKDMSDVILLLDEMFDPPLFVLDQLKKQIAASILKKYG